MAAFSFSPAADSTFFATNYFAPPQILWGIPTPFNGQTIPADLPKAAPSPANAAQVDASLEVASVAAQAIQQAPLPAASIAPPIAQTIRLISPKPVETYSCSPKKILEAWNKLTTKFTATWSWHSNVKKICPVKNRPIFRNADHQELWARLENFGLLYESIKRHREARMSAEYFPKTAFPIAERSNGEKPYIIGYVEIATGKPHYYEPADNTLAHLHKIDKN